MKFGTHDKSDMLIINTLRWIDDLDLKEEILEIFSPKLEMCAITAWKVSKYGVISGPYFPVFGLNTGKYRPEITQYLDTFHAVNVYEFWHSELIEYIKFV